MAINIHVTVGITNALDALLTKLLAALDGEISAADQATLKAVLDREAARAAKLDALDERNPPKP